MGRWPQFGLLALAVAALACTFPGFAGSDVPSPTAADLPAAVAPTVTPSAEPTLPPSPIPTIAYTAAFESTSCAFFPPQGYAPECGYLLVPENRFVSGSPMIRLHVAIFRSLSPNPAPDPVIHLSGGPGSAALDLAWYHFARGAGRFLETRDYIVFDQRGTGHSEPSLACPEREDIEATLLTQPLTLEQANELEVSSLRACHDRLVGQGIDLTAYNSAASATDVDDLITTLGYQRANLYGVSYGTRLALTVIRDHPEHIRSVILDSAYPPQEDLYRDWPASAERAFNVLFDGCARDPACDAAFPDLRGTLFAAVDSLNASPARVSVTDPVSGRSYDALLTGDLLVDVVFTGLYSPDVIPRMPRLISDVGRGYYSPFLQERLARYFDHSTSYGMQASVQCREEIPFSSAAELAAASAGVETHIRHNYVVELQSLYAVCDFWGSGEPNPVENQAVASDIPTLILAGEYDPITPPAWGQTAGETLTHAFFYEFPGVGHWVLRVDNPCPMQIAVEFLGDPAGAPNGDCIQAMPSPAFTR